MSLNDCAAESSNFCTRAMLAAFRWRGGVVGSLRLMSTQRGGFEFSMACEVNRRRYKLKVLRRWNGPAFRVAGLWMVLDDGEQLMGSTASPIIALL